MKPHAADGFLFVVAPFAFARHAVFGQGVGMRTAADAVLDGAVADLDGGEQVFEVGDLAGGLADSEITDG